jgi:hypothetical protein
MSGDGLASIPLYLRTVGSVHSSTISTVLISFGDLVAATSTLKAIETANKTRLELFDAPTLLANLQEWAGTGFQDSYIVYQLPVVSSQKNGNLYTCSDGTNRTTWDYIAFCLGYPITTLVASFQTKVKDMTFSFSVQETPSVVLSLHVSKA